MYVLRLIVRFDLAYIPVVTHIKCRLALSIMHEFISSDAFLIYLRYLRRYT